MEAITKFYNSRTEEQRQVIAAVGLSLGFSQVTGSLVILTQTISGIANIIRTGLLTSRIIGLTLKTGKVYKLSSEEISKNKNLLEGSKVEIRNNLRNLKQNMHRIAASILCLCPVVGLFAASAYLSATEKMIVNGTKAEMRTAALAKLLIAGGPLGLLSGLLSKAIYPLSHTPLVGDFELANSFTNANFAKEIKVRVDRGDGKKHEICCHYHNANNGDPTAKTMVLFHGNGMIGSQMVRQGNEYAHKGWNVLLVTMGGYPGSDEGVSTNETSSIQDVRGVLDHLKNLGVTSIGVHGFSIGGTLAAHAMKMEPELVDHAILDRTLNNGPAVAANMLKNVVAPNVGMVNPKLENLIRSISNAVVWGVTEGALNLGQEVPGVPGYFTDGIDNVEKVKGFRHNLAVIGGTYDSFMGQEPDSVNSEITKYAKNFSEEIAEAHRKAQPDSRTIHHFAALRHASPLDHRTWNIIASMA